MSSDFLGVPADFIEPMGRLAIAAGRIETTAAIVLRAFLRPLPSPIRGALLDRKQFATVTELVKNVVSSDPVISEIDPAFQADWGAWSKRATRFMQQRNSWLHSSWAQAQSGEHVPVSPTRSAPQSTPATVTAIEDAARAAVELVSQGETLFRRALVVSNDPQYLLERTNSFPPGVTAI